jgi:hypothetical protein
MRKRDRLNFVLSPAVHVAGPDRERRGERKKMRA